MKFSISPFIWWHNRPWHLLYHYYIQAEYLKKGKYYLINSFPVSWEGLLDFIESFCCTYYKTDFKDTSIYLVCAQLKSHSYFIMWIALHIASHSIHLNEYNNFFPLVPSIPWCFLYTHNQLNRHDAFALLRTSKSARFTFQKFQAGKVQGQTNYYIFLY